MSNKLKILVTLSIFAFILTGYYFYFSSTSVKNQPPGKDVMDKNPAGSKDNPDEKEKPEEKESHQEEGEKPEENSNQEKKNNESEEKQKEINDLPWTYSWIGTVLSLILSFIVYVIIYRCYIGKISLFL